MFKVENWWQYYCNIENLTTFNFAFWGNKYVLRIELYARIFRLVLPLTTHIIFTQLRAIDRERERERGS